MTRARRPTALLASLLLAALAFAFGCGSRGEKPRLDVAVVPLLEGKEIGPDATKIPFAPATHPSLLSFPIPPHLATGVLETRILSGDGKLVWVGVGLRRTESGGGNVFLPARFLPKGDYKLLVGRSGPDAVRGEFPFRVG